MMLKWCCLGLWSNAQRRVRQYIHRRQSYFGRIKLEKGLSASGEFKEYRSKQENIDRESRKVKTRRPLICFESEFRSNQITSVAAVVEPHSTQLVVSL